MSEFVKIIIRDCIMTGLILGALIAKKNNHSDFDWFIDTVAVIGIWAVLKIIYIYLLNKYKSKKLKISRYISGTQKQVILTSLPYSKIRKEFLLLINSSDATLINNPDDHEDVLKSIFHAGNPYPGERVDIYFEKSEDSLTKITISSYHLLDNVNIDFGRCAENIAKFTTLLDKMAQATHDDNTHLVHIVRECLN